MIEFIIHLTAAAI